MATTAFPVISKSAGVSNVLQVVLAADVIQISGQGVKRLLPWSGH